MFIAQVGLRKRKLLFAYLVTWRRFAIQKINYNTMGRGDKKTKKGKIFKGSFGKSRPARPVKVAAKEEQKAD